MKRLFPVLLALLLALSACGGKTPAPVTPAPAPEAPASAPETSAPATPAPEPPDEQHYPQADDALVREIIKTYGAEETTGPDGVTRLVPTIPSLFSRTGSWTDPWDLTIEEFYYWFLSTTFEEDFAYKKEHYTHPATGGWGWFYPQDLFEERVMTYFQLGKTQLRQEGDVYRSEMGGYWVEGFAPGIGEKPEITYTYRQRERVLDIDLTSTCSSGTTHGELRVRLLRDGGWRYISWSFFPQGIPADGDLWADVDLPKEQKELVERGWEITSLFETCPGDQIDPSGGDGVILEIDGTPYLHNSGARYKDWNDFQSAMLSVFTPEFFQQVNTAWDGTPHAVDHDGELYYRPGGMDYRNLFYLGDQDRFFVRREEKDIWITRRVFFADEDILQGMDNADWDELTDWMDQHQTPFRYNESAIHLVNSPDGWRVAEMVPRCLYREDLTGPYF